MPCFSLTIISWLYLDIFCLLYPYNFLWHFLSIHSSTEEHIVDELSSVPVFRPSTLRTPNTPSSSHSTAELTPRGGAVGFLGAEDWADTSQQLPLSLSLSFSLTLFLNFSLFQYIFSPEIVLMILYNSLDLLGEGSVKARWWWWQHLARQRSTRSERRHHLTWRRKGLWVSCQWWKKRLRMSIGGCSLSLSLLSKDVFCTLISFFNFKCTLILNFACYSIFG